MRLAVVDNIVSVPVSNVVKILHTNYWNDARRGLNVLYAHLRKSYFPNLPLVSQVLQQAELIVSADTGVDPMKLEKIDPLDAEASEASFAL
jgi:hypothetical protein